MKKTMKKLLATMLVCVMILASLPSAFAAEGEFAISSLASQINVPNGKTVTVNADSLPDGTAKLVLYKSKDGVTKGAVAAESEGASVQVTLSTDDACFIAEAVDASGEVLATSNALAMKGSFERESEVRWNLDFSSHSIGAHRWGGGYVQLNDNATGSAAYSGSDYFTAHRANENNTLETKDTGDADHGTALHFAAVDTNEVQLNEFMVTHSGSVLKYEEDVMVDALPTTGSAGIVRPMQVVLAGGVWLSPLDMKTDGENIYFAYGDNVLDAELNTWYNLVCYADLENCVYSYYIDDTLFATGTIAEGITGGQKFAPRLNNAPGASMWIDNFKASSVSISPDGLSFDLVADIQNANVPGGKKVRLTASSLPEGTVKVEFCKADSEGNVKDVIDVVSATETATYEYEVAKGVNTLIAKCYDASGSILGKSNKLTFRGYYEEPVATRWDIDFEDEYAGAHRWGYPYVSIYNANGSDISSGGDSLTAHAGTTANSITTEPAADASHGNALKFVAADTNEVQLNEFASTLGGDVLVWEWDWLLSKLPTTGSDATVQIMQPVVATGNWMSAVFAKVSGETVSITAGSSSIPASLNTWYNIKAYADLKAGKYTIYVNDVVLYSTTISTGLTNGQKVVAKLANATGAEMWIDNYKMYSVTVTENPPPIVLSANCEDITAVGGKSYTFTASVLPEETEEVVFWNVTADGEKISVIASTNDTTADLKLKYGTNYILAEALDASGDVCNKSEIFTLNTKYENTTEVRWDIDFEGEYAGAHRWGAPYVSFFAENGSELTSKGDTLTAHAGSADNVIATEPAQDASHGKALKFEARDTAQVQLNEFHATPTGKVIKYEFDYMLDNLPSTGADATITVMQPVMAGGSWLGALNVKVSGEEISFAHGSYTQSAKLDTWYKITAYADLENAKISYYIDGKYFASSSTATGLTGGQKFVSKLQNAPQAVAWLDNLVISSLSFETPEIGLGGVSYIIGGEEAESVGAGTLSVIPTVTSNGSALDVSCFVAVYNDDELINVKIAPYSFGEDEVTHTFEAIDMGTLSGTEKVKVMLWKNGSVTPLDVAEILE